MKTHVRSIGPSLAKPWRIWRGCSCTILFPEFVCWHYFCYKPQKRPVPVQTWNFQEQTNMWHAIFVRQSCQSCRTKILACRTKTACHIWMKNCMSHMNEELHVTYEWITACHIWMKNCMSHMNEELQSLYDRCARAMPHSCVTCSKKLTCSRSKESETRAQCCACCSVRDVTCATVQNQVYNMSVVLVTRSGGKEGETCAQRAVRVAVCVAVCVAVWLNPLLFSLHVCAQRAVRVAVYAAWRARQCRNKCAIRVWLQCVLKCLLQYVVWRVLQHVVWHVLQCRNKCAIWALCCTACCTACCAACYNMFAWRVL